MTISGYDDAYTTGVVDMFTPSSSVDVRGDGGGGATSGTWAEAPCVIPLNPFFSVLLSLCYLLPIITTRLCLILT